MSDRASQSMSAAPSDSDGEWLLELFTPRAQPKTAVGDGSDDEWLKELLTSPMVEQRAESSAPAGPSVPTAPADVGRGLTAQSAVGASPRRGKRRRLAKGKEVEEEGCAITWAPRWALEKVRGVKGADLSISVRFLLWRSSLGQALSATRERQREIGVDGVAAFKIGIAYDPRHRFRNKRFGYCWKGFTEMQLLSLTTATDARDLEASLINAFVGTTGCHNIKLGGDGITPCAECCFVYCVFADAKGDSFINAVRDRRRRQSAPIG